MIIFIIIILYFVAYFCTYFFSKDDMFFEVIEGSTTSTFDGQYTALVLRTESTVASKAAGYVNFFVGDAAPIYVGEQAYMIDKSGELSARLKAVTQSQAILTENDLSSLRNSINDFKATLNNDSYYETYHFKYQLESQILDLINGSIFESNGALAASSYGVYPSEYAGIAVHYTDGFEGYTTDSLESSMFKRNDYSKKIVKANDYVELGDPVFKVITSENWNLVIQINDPSSFEDQDVVTVEFLKDGISANGNFKLLAKGGKYYGVISLNKYMVRYASERYLQISFIDDTSKGYKIPETAVAEREFFAIPTEYFTQGSNSSDFGVIVKTHDSNGKEFVEMRFPTIVREVDDLTYIPMDEGIINSGDILLKTDSTSEFKVGMKAALPGVYVNNGNGTYFRYIEIIGENSGFYIIDSNTPSGVNLYDQVYTDYKDAEKK